MTEKMTKKQVRDQKNLNRPSVKKAREARKKELDLIDQKHKKKVKEKDVKADKKNKKEIIAKKVA